MSEVNPVINTVQQMARQIISKLEDENFVDSDSMYDVGMNVDYYEGKIAGRNEAIELLVERFGLERI